MAIPTEFDPLGLSSVEFVWMGLATRFTTWQRFIKIKLKNVKLNMTTSWKIMEIPITLSCTIQGLMGLKGDLFLEGKPTYTKMSKWIVDQLD